MTPSHIVDAHHHVWDLSAVHYPWLMEKGVERFFGDPTPIQRNYLPSDLLTDIGSLPVTKSVHIQVGAEDGLEEHRWLNSLRASHHLPSALVAFCDLRQQDREESLDQLSSIGGLSGIRQIVGRSAKEDRQTGTASLLTDDLFLAGLKSLAVRDLSFDLQLTPPQMQMAAKLFLKVPDLPVALCHAGSLSDFSKKGIAEWRDGLKALAQQSRMICKISGFGMFDHTWTEASIRDFVLMAIDIFTPQRVAFGSNFPVDKLYTDYQDLWRAYLNITADFSKSERERMFAGTAEAFYKL